MALSENPMPSRLQHFVRAKFFFNLISGIESKCLLPSELRYVKGLHSSVVVLEMNSQQEQIGIKSVKSSKHELEGFFSKLVVAASFNSMPRSASNFIVDDIRTVNILGGSIVDSQLLKGMLVTTPPKSACTYKEAGTKGSVFMCSLDATQTEKETKGTVLLHSDELMNYNHSEALHPQRLHEIGVDVVIDGQRAVHR